MHGWDTQVMLELPYSQLVRKVLRLIPSEPELEITLDLLKADMLAFEKLFFGSSSEESQISKHHKFEPKLKRLEVKQGEAITSQHLPFPTSGNAADDQLSSLIASFQDPVFVPWAWNNLSLDRIDRILYSLKELAVPEEARLTNYIAKIALEQNPDLMSLREAEESFKDVERIINTGKLENGWQVTRG